MRPHPLALRALALALALPSLAAAQTTVVLDGTIADGTPRYFAVPFTVPEGTVELEVSHDDMSAANILDWGLRDPERFRGWGGGNTENAVVGVSAASRSYLPGAMPAGTWNVMIGQALIAESPARYHVVITLRTAPTLAPMPERRPYAPAAALAQGPRWYAGDFHAHSRESGDAHPTLDTMAAYARSRGLDFLELSDHNTVSQLDLVADAQSRFPQLLFLPGVEFTTYAGHANGIGATRWVDFTRGTGPGISMHDEMAAFVAQGALFSINHPMLDLGTQCIGCAWTLEADPQNLAAIEVQTGRYSLTGPLFYQRVQTFWESYLEQGLHLAPIGGSDDHSGGVDMGNLSSTIGSPTTMVYAQELSASAIIAAVRAGHTVVKLESPADPMVELSAGSAIVGDTVRAPHATLSATVTGGDGAALRFYRNGRSAAFRPVSGASFTTTLEVDAPAGNVDDRWRVELLVSGVPRVVTGHVWVAATGEPAVDAGAVLDAAAPTPDAATPTLDAAPDAGPTTRGGGCGCAIPAGSRSGQSALALGALGALLAAARRRRRA